MKIETGMVNAHLFNAIRKLYGNRSLTSNFDTGDHE